METIKQFDQKILKNCDSNGSVKTFFRYFLEVLTFMMSCIPIETLEVEGFIIFFVDVVILICMSLYMFPYFMVKENGYTVSIGDKLKYTPIDTELFAKDRRIKMWKYIAKTVTIITVLQFLGGYLSKTGDWRLMTLLPVSLFIILVLNGHYSIVHFLNKLK